MAQHVERKMRFNIPAKKVWEVLGDFSSAEKFGFTIEKSPLLNGKNSGVGTKRKCDFYDGTSAVEEIIEYQEGKSFKVEVAEFSMPLKSLKAGWKLEEVDATTSDISMYMDFMVKGGPFGWLMGFFLMRPMMKGVAKKMMTGLVYHAATGKLVGKKVPSQEDLSWALSS